MVGLRLNALLGSDLLSVTEIPCQITAHPGYAHIHLESTNQKLEYNTRLGLVLPSQATPSVIAVYHSVICISSQCILGEVRTTCGQQRLNISLS